MTNEEAQQWIVARWGEAAVAKLSTFAELLCAENQRQNLVAQLSLARLWSRHIADSAQLVPLAERHAGLWIDVGTGGGFPGVVVATLRPAPMLLVEPRRKRADFLSAACRDLKLDHVQVRAARIERVSATAAVLSARAVAQPSDLLERSAHVLTPDTLLLLPRGRDTGDAVREMRVRWRGLFHVEQSITEAESGIIVGSGIEKR